MKTYLDNNVVSAIAKDDTASESEALDRLVRAYEQGKVELVTSEVTLGEIKRFAGPARKPVARVTDCDEQGIGMTISGVEWQMEIGAYRFEICFDLGAPCSLNQRDV